MLVKGITCELDVRLTVTVTLVGDGDLEVDLGQVRVVGVGLTGHTRRETLAEVEQVQSRGEAGIAASGDEDPDNGRHCWESHG